VSPGWHCTSASGYGIRPGFEVPDAAMMALVLGAADDSWQVPQGTITYPAAFGV
jgi:predicted N-acetyltransferase YhbS